MTMRVADETTPLDAPKETSLVQSIKNKEDAETYETFKAGVGFIPGSVIGGADTILQSVGLIDDNTVGNALNSISETVGETYEKNQNLYRGAGDVASMFIGAGLASKLLRTGSYGMKALSRTGKAGEYAERLISTNYDRVDTMHELYRRRAMLYTKDGILNSGKIPKQRMLRSATLKSNVLNNVKDGIAGEAFVVAFQNKSELFFPEGQSWTDIATMGGLGVGLGGGIGALVTNARLRRAAAAAGSNLPESLTKVSGNAGTDLVAGAFEIENVKRGPQTKLVQDDETARGAFAQRAVGGKALVKEATEKLTKASPIDGVTGDVSSELTGRKLQDAMEERATTQPELTANILSIEKFDTSFNYNAKRDALVMKKKDDLVELEKTIKSKPSSGEKDTLMFKATQAREEIQRLEKDTYMVEVDKLNIAGVNGERTNTLFHSDYNVNRLKPSTKNPTSDVYKAFDKTTKERALFGLADNGLVMHGDRVVQNTNKLALKNIAEVYSAMPKAVDGLLTKLSDPKAVFGAPVEIDKNTPLETLDFFMKVVEKSGGNPTTIAKAFSISPKLGQTVADIKKLALEKRYDRWMELKKDNNVSGYDMTVATNLRMADDYGTNSPAYEWFEDLFATEGRDAIRNLKTYDDALKGYRVNYAVNSSPGTVQELISGSASRMDELLEFDMAGRLEKDYPAHSLLMKANNDEIDSLTMRKFRDLGEIVREDRSRSLRDDALNAEIPSFLGPIARLYDESKDFVDEIRRSLPQVDQTQVSTPVLREMGQASPFTKNHRTRHTVAGNDTSAWSDNVIRNIRGFLKTVTEEVLPPVQLMRQRQHVASMQLYNNYHSAMQNGWRLADDVVDSSGMFKLSTDEADLAHNQAVAERMFGSKDIPEFLPDVMRDNKAPLVLDEIARDALEAMRKVDRMIYNGNQMLTKAVGRPVKEYMRGHTIIPSRFGQEMVFITDETGTVIDYTLGRTKQLAEEAASKRIKGKKNPERYNVTNKNDVENYKMLMDQAFNSNALDISDSFALTSGRQVEGGRSGIIQGVDFVNAQMDEIENLVMQQANRYTAVEFMPELNQMKHMQTLANVEKTNAKGDQTFDDVYDLTSSMLLNSNNRNAGSAYAQVDNVFENTMNGMLNKMAEIYGGSSLKRSFDLRNANKLAKEMDEKFGYHPLKRTEELLFENAQISTKVKNDIRQITNKAGALTQMVALKFFETGHALLTTASVMTTVPHSMSVFRRIGDESDEAYKSRLGYAAEFLPNGTVFPNEIKMTTHTINKFMRGGYQDVLDEARERGYLDAPIGEFMSALGDRSRSKSGEWTNKVLNASGALSQGSESFARSISFLTAYDMFRKAGGQGKQISMTLANDMANRVIADYRPHNRAELFKGVTGVPIGMFQSFAINYFEKMFSAIENKNTRELAVRYGTQSFMFGAGGVAGFDFLNETMLNNWDKSQNPENYIKQGTDKGLSDLMLYGTLSNLPKMLGLGDGIALHTRGEIQTPKTFGIPRPAESPMFNFGGRAMGFLSDALSNAKENGGYSWDAVQEGLIMAATNRPLRGWLELAQGYSTNTNHDIVKKDTREFASVVARMVGLKTLREAEEAKALWNNRQTELQVRDKNIRLRKALTARVRDNKLTGREANEFMRQYIDNGGSPSYAKRWLRDAARKAHVNKFDDELRKAMKRDPNGRDTLRFMELDF